jgi:hypothetical protein
VTATIEQRDSCPDPTVDFIDNWLSLAQNLSLSLFSYSSQSEDSSEFYRRAGAPFAYVGERGARTALHGALQFDSVL